MALSKIFGLATKSDIIHISEAMTTLTDALNAHSQDLEEQNAMVHNLMVQHNIPIESKFPFY